MSWPMFVQKVLLVALALVGLLSFARPASADAVVIEGSPGGQIDQFAARFDAITAFMRRHDPPAIRAWIKQTRRTDAAHDPPEGGRALAALYPGREIASSRVAQAI
jgi:hypothetical protein